MTCDRPRTTTGWPTLAPFSAMDPPRFQPPPLFSSAFPPPPLAWPSAQGSRDEASSVFRSARESEGTTSRSEHSAPPTAAQWQQAPAVSARGDQRYPTAMMPAATFFPMTAANPPPQLFPFSAPALPLISGPAPPFLPRSGDHEHDGGSISVAAPVDERVSSLAKQSTGCYSGRRDAGLPNTD